MLSNALRPWEKASALPESSLVAALVPLEKYIPHIGIALQEILDLSDGERDKTVNTLDDVLQKSRKF